MQADLELAMQTKLNPDFVQSLFGLRAQIEACKHGEKRELIERFAAQHAKNPSTIYGWLKSECGFEAGRKVRSDRGNTRQDPKALELIASFKREAVRGNKKAIMPTSVAMNIADANGHAVSVSASRMNALLRQEGLTQKALAAPRDTVRLLSLHPNHVHQIDPSLCVLYYINGKQEIMDEQQFNKNKLENYAKVKLKCWRYVRYDHASGAIDIRYFAQAGENQQAIFEFLQWTWGKQANRLSYGVPKRLLWDKGSANISNAVKNMLDALGVAHETHAAGHAWVKGGVEVSNNIVETHFESRLKIEPVDNIDQLNAAAELWVRDYNANKIKFVDSRIKRDDGIARSRDDLWSRIAASELVVMPPENICRWFFHGAAQARKVTNLQISFKHPELETTALYKLHDWAEHLTKGERVQVLPLLGRAGAVRIAIEQLGSKESLIVEVLPIANFDQYGRDADGQVIGEGYKRAPDSATVQAAKRLNESAYGVRDLDDADKLRSKNNRPFADANDGQGMVAHSNLGKAELVLRLPRKAGEVDTPAMQQALSSAGKVERPTLSITEACTYIQGILGEAYETSIYGELKARYPAGRVPQDVADIYAHPETEQLATGTNDARARPTLVRVK